MTLDEKEFLALLNGDSELCSRCCSNVITPGTVAARHNVCVNCYKRAQVESNEQKLLRLELLRQDAALRKGIQRNRERLFEELGGKKVVARLLGVEVGDVEKRS